RKAEGDVDFSEVEKGMAGAKGHASRQRFDGLRLLLDAEAVHRVRGRNGDAKKIRADVCSRVCDVWIRGIGRDDDAGEENVGLNAALFPIEVEVVDAAEGENGVVEAGVVMNASDDERSGGVEPLFDDALARLVFLDVAHALLRFADDAGVGGR